MTFLDLSSWLDLFLWFMLIAGGFMGALFLLDAIVRRFWR